jgi:hypothetical protein
MIGYFPWSIFNPSPNSTTHDHQSSSDQRFSCIKHEGSLLLECQSFEPSQDLRLTLLPQPTTMINYGFNFSFSHSRRPPYSQILARYDTPKHSRNRLTSDDKKSRSDEWYLTFPNLWFCLHRMAPTHLHSNPRIHISLHPTVAITLEFEMDGHDTSIPYKGSLTFWLLCVLCSAIPLDIFNFKVINRSQPRDFDQ